MATPKQMKKLIEVFEETPTEQMQDILESGLLADLRSRRGIKCVSRNSFRKFLGLKIESRFVKFIGTVAIPATTEKFTAKYNFEVNTSKDALVKISRLDINFMERFLGKIENPIDASVLEYHKILQPCGEEPIISKIGEGSEVETTLTEMFFLMKKQRSGKSGILLNDGRSNIFFICNINDVLRAVFVSWKDGGWNLSVDDVWVAGSWGGGDQVFSHNYHDLRL